MLNSIAFGAHFGKTEKKIKEDEERDRVDKRERETY